MYQKHHNHTAHFAPSVETLQCPVFSINIFFCTLQSVTLIQSSNTLKPQNYGMSLSASQNWEYTVIYGYFSIYYLQQGQSRPNSWQPCRKHLSTVFLILFLLFNPVYKECPQHFF